MKTIFKIILIVLIVAFYLIQYQVEKIPTNSDYEIRTVVYVIDGDTVITDDNKKIRLIGINTPEISSGEEMSYDAKELAEEILLNKTVYLEKDKETVDKYNRELRYIWLEKPSEISYDSILNYNFSAIMLDRGMAKVYTIKPNDKYKSYFQKIQNKAKKDKVGMWRISENGVTKGDI